MDSGFKISGTTVIADNAGGNLTLQNGTALVEFALSRGAEIGLGYRTVPEGGYYTVSPKRTGDCRQYLSSDDSGFSITYSYSDNGSNDSRKIHYVEKGHENDDRDHC
ncbi:MAG: hypothetical protein IJH95_07720 [Mogibacterium sp.]|nr:hypothetical protein [Mogibacterium sp.]